MSVPAQYPTPSFLHPHLPNLTLLNITQHAQPNFRIEYTAQSCLRRRLYKIHYLSDYGGRRNIYIYNRIEQCALPVTTIMALWQLVNLGTRCTVTHCRIALWSHQSAQTASSERCIMQIVNVSLRDSPPNP